MLRGRRGFTLIELLIVVVIIAILAKIAIPKFADTKRKAYVAAMKSDLKNIVIEAEAYFADNNSYAGFVPPAGASGTTITFRGSRTGWVATARNTRARRASCRVGTGRNTPAGLAEGQPGGANCK